MFNKSKFHFLLLVISLSACSQNKTIFNKEKIASKRLPSSYDRSDIRILDLNLNVNHVTLDTMTTEGVYIAPASKFIGEYLEKNLLVNSEAGKGSTMNRVDPSLVTNDYVTVGCKWEINPSSNAQKIMFHREPPIRISSIMNTGFKKPEVTIRVSLNNAPYIICRIESVSCQSDYTEKECYNKFANTKIFTAELIDSFLNDWGFNANWDGAKASSQEI